MKCPHCKKVILSAAQQAVLRHAKKSATVAKLAFVYGTYRPTMTRLSCRRAVERMVAMGVLKRVKPGCYKIARQA